MSSEMHLPNVTIKTDEALAPNDMLRLVLAFGVALVIDQGGSIQVSRETWQSLSGKHVSIQFHQTDDGFVISASVGG